MALFCYIEKQLHKGVEDLEFYDLSQSGSEVQQLLDSISGIKEMAETTKTDLSKLPVKNITEQNFDISTKIISSGIYYIPSKNIDKTKITPTTLVTNSDYTIIIHLQNLLNNVVYRSQYLITQDINMSMVFYKRDANGDNWTEFINPQEDQKNEILNYLKIKSFSQGG